MTKSKAEKNTLLGSYKLTDLVSLEKLQQIQDAFAESTQVASTITEIDGTPITIPSNHSKVCQLIRNTQTGLKNCMTSGEYLGKQAAKLMEPIHRKCLSCGFTDAAAPIIVNGEHIANWLVGQYHIRDVDENRIRQYAHEIEADEKEMIKAFSQMPKLSTETFEKILSFLWLMANEISMMGYQNLQLKKTTEELHNLTNTLEEHQAQLEIIINKRTTDLVSANEKLRREIRRQSRVQDSQSRLIEAIEHTAEGIVITDKTSIITYVNPAFEKMTGYSSSETIGKKTSLLKSGKHDQEFYKKLWKTILSGKIWQGRFQNRTKQGKIYDEASTISPVIDGNGSIQGFVCIKRDITKELELERKLMQENKLESIGTLAAGIAHEINSPVQFIRSNIEFLEDAFSDIFEVKKNICQSISQTNSEILPKLNKQLEDGDWEYLANEIPIAIEQSRDGIARVSTIVNAMKNFSHPVSKEMTLNDLNQIIENTIIITSNEWKYNAEIIREFDSNLPKIPLLADEMGQVILNLLVNAIHAIKTKQEALEATDKGKITISTELQNDTISMSISDTGCGIPEDVKERIFDPFFTTKEVGKGTGQGLAITHDIITNKHSGEIQFKTEEGIGTTFTIFLPIESTM